MEPKGKDAKSPFAEQTERSPRQNEQAAEREMNEEEKRREVEQAQANKKEAEKEKRGGTLGAVADINSAMTSRD